MFFRHPLPLLTKAVPPLHIAPKTTRLLLQDLHAPFADATQGALAQKADAKILRREFDEYYGALEIAATAICRCLNACRERTIPVRYTCLGYYPPAAPSAFQRATGWEWDLNGEDGRFPTEWEPQAGETIHAKPGWSALAGVSLAHELQADGVTCVILCGAMLEYGIRQTSIALADAGIGVLLVADACISLTHAGRSAISGSLSHGLIKVRSAGELSGLFAENPFPNPVLI